MAVQPIGAPPTARLSFGRLAAINAFWFGGGAHWQPIYISLIPVGATLIAGSNADLLIGLADYNLKIVAREAVAVNGNLEAPRSSAPVPGFSKAGRPPKAWSPSETPIIS